MKTTENNGQFRPGEPRPANAGRKKGSPNKATAQMKTICARLIEDPLYEASLKKRLHAGELAPAVECLLLHYYAGKPKDELEVSAANDLASLLAGRR